MFRNGSASPTPVTGTTTALSVLGADDGGEGNLIYTWATTGTPPAAVTFSANGTDAAKNTTATFTKAGTYTLQVTIADSQGAAVSGSADSTLSLRAQPTVVASPIDVSAGNATSLDILNPSFEPDPVAILQNHVDAANAALAGDPTLAQNFLSPKELNFQTPEGFSLSYGKAIERMVQSDVENNPLSDSLFEHVGGRDDPDFVGRANTVADPFQFDITTVNNTVDHTTRPYGQDTYLITYTIPDIFDVTIGP